jgi:glyoxylase-like metal-dependent hydrolase (beta-lactamase superfamily II)
MNRSLLLRIFGCLFALLFAWAGFTQTEKTARPLRLEKVKDDLYMVGGEGGNVAVYVTTDGVILVDDMFDRNHNDILAQVKSVTDKPLKYVLNTHQHDDHAGGDARMLPIAEVIAHRNARANLVARRQPYYEDTPGTPIGLPRITFSDETAVHLGGKEVRASYYGRGHTNGDAVIYFPDLKVVHTGDLFLGRAAGGRGRAGAGPAPRGQHLRRLRAGRQLPRVDGDARQAPQDRLRHRHPGSRTGVEEGGRGEVPHRPRSHAEPSVGDGQAG